MTSGTWTDESPHRSAFAVVNGVRLHYLDWGGEGEPLVLVHGLGDSPHLFDDLAPHLTNRFRVVAYARRGHGDSDAPEGPYDLATLVEDLRLLLDELGFERVNLLGWSMGGNEVTRFAGLYPERVAALVYLDAGYELSDPAFLHEAISALGIVAPDASDLANLQAYRDHCRASMFGEMAWTSGLEAFVRDTTIAGPDGSVAPRMSGSVEGALFDSVAGAPRDYGKVRARALALYASSFFPAVPREPQKAEAIEHFERRVMDPFRRENMERVRRELHARVELISGATHMSIGVHDTAALAETIGSFLLAPTTHAAEP